MSRIVDEDVLIKTRPTSQEYRDNWERIFGEKPPGVDVEAVIYDLVAKIAKFGPAPTHVVIHPSRCTPELIARLERAGLTVRYSDDDNELHVY